MNGSTGGGGVILLYHRVIELPTDPQLLCVSPTHFAEHLEVLRRVAAPMKLSEMVAAADRLPERAAVAITFDDGYWDNLHIAGPLLRAAGVNATVFATTGHRDREFFWDELDRIFLQPGTLPRTLDVRALAYSAYLGDDAVLENLIVWDVTQPAVPTARHRIYRELCELIHRANADARELTLNELTAWAGMGKAGRASHRMMTSDEIRAMGRDPAYELGAHTRRHPRLVSESPSSQKDEIANELKAMVGSSVRGFSYPFGTRHDYTAETVGFVRDAGYAYACSNFNGLVMPGTDPYQLPRFLVRDWDGAEFERRLAGFFNWKPRTMGKS